MKIRLTGDVMLGQLVDQYVIQNRSVRFSQRTRRFPHEQIYSEYEVQ